MCTQQAVITPSFCPKRLGPEGAVLAQNTERGLHFKEDRQEITQGEALKSKILEGDLTNVTQLIGNVTAPRFIRRLTRRCSAYAESA